MKNIKLILAIALIAVMVALAVSADPVGKVYIANDDTDAGVAIAINAQYDDAKIQTLYAKVVYDNTILIPCEEEDFTATLDDYSETGDFVIPLWNSKKSFWTTAVDTTYAEDGNYTTLVMNLYTQTAKTNNDDIVTMWFAFAPGKSVDDLVTGTFDVTEIYFGDDTATNWANNYDEVPNPQAFTFTNEVVSEAAPEPVTFFVSFTIGENLIKSVSGVEEGTVASELAPSDAALASWIPAGKVFDKWQVNGNDADLATYTIDADTEFVAILADEVIPEPATDDPEPVDGKPYGKAYIVSDDADGVAIAINAAFADAQIQTLYAKVVYDNTILVPCEEEDFTAVLDDPSETGDFVIPLWNSKKSFWTNAVDTTYAEDGNYTTLVMNLYTQTAKTNDDDIVTMWFAFAPGKSKDDLVTGTFDVTEIYFGDDNATNWANNYDEVPNPQAFPFANQVVTKSGTPEPPVPATYSVKFTVNGESAKLIDGVAEGTIASTLAPTDAEIAAKLPDGKIFEKWQLNDADVELDAYAIAGNTEFVAVLADEPAPDPTTSVVSQDAIGFRTQETYTGGVRFKATFSTALKGKVSEYGYLATVESPKQDLPDGYTLDMDLVAAGKATKKIAYNATTDIFWDVEGDSTIVTAALHGTPIEKDKLTMNIVARPYYIYKDVAYYGDVMKTTPYALAKSIKTDGGADYTGNQDYIDTIIGTVETVEPEPVDDPEPEDGKPYGKAYIVDESEDGVAIAINAQYADAMIQTLYAKVVYDNTVLVPCEEEDFTAPLDDPSETGDFVIPLWNSKKSFWTTAVDTTYDVDGNYTTLEMNLYTQTAKTNDDDIVTMWFAFAPGKSKADLTAGTFVVESIYFGDDTATNWANNYDAVPNPQAFPFANQVRPSGSLTSADLFSIYVDVSKLFK